MGRRKGSSPAGTGILIVLGLLLAALLAAIDQTIVGTAEPRIIEIAPISAPLGLMRAVPVRTGVSDGAMTAIEKAIMESDLGLTPTNDGQMIRINIPQLTEQRRKELVKLVHKMAEDARIAVRNVRRDVLNEAKRAEKDGDMSKDEVGRFQGEVQKVTDAEVAKIDEVLAKKEAEIMEV